MVGGGRSAQAAQEPRGVGPGPAPTAQIITAAGAAPPFERFNGGPRLTGGAPPIDRGGKPRGEGGAAVGAGPDQDRPALQIGTTGRRQAEPGT